MPKRTPKDGTTSAHEQILQRAVDMNASDVHVVAGLPIFFRINGELFPQTQEDASPEFCVTFMRGLLGDEAWARFSADREIDASYQIASGARFRVNCAFEREQPTLAARIIPQAIPTLEELDLQNIAARFCDLKDGLVLFTGPTGTGKSTSLASILQYMSQTRAVNIVTLEDPIEFLFARGKGIIRQRQYMQDFLSFDEALKHVLRQDPEIIMVGEMRDPETIAAALTLAETGHLIFATLHTPNTTQTIDRIIDAFEPHQQPQIRAQLSLSLRGVVAQMLIPSAGGRLVALREVLMNTPAVGNIIRDNRLTELKSVIQTSGDEGMLTFARDAKRLYKAGVINKATYDFAVSLK